MSYALEIPKHLLREMYLIRQRTGVSIREQIMQAIESHIADKEMHQMSCDKGALVLKPVDEGISKVFNTKTARFHNVELGIDIV